MGSSIDKVCITLRRRGTKNTTTVYGKKTMKFRGSSYGIEIRREDWKAALWAIGVKTKVAKSIPIEVVVQYICNKCPDDIKYVVVLPVNNSRVTSSAIKLEVDSR